MQNDDMPLLTRAQAVEFIREACGIPVSQSTLDKKSQAGRGGPPIARFYGRRALYSKNDLRDWALGLTSEQPQAIDAA
jgi:hypothetical protein